MKRTPRVGDIVVVMKPCRGDTCSVCDSVLGRTALVSHVFSSDQFLLRFGRRTPQRGGYLAHQLHVTGLTT